MLKSLAIKFPATFLKTQVFLGVKEFHALHNDLKII